RPILRHQHQPAIGHRLGNDTQMRTVRQQPIVLLGLTSGKPASELAPPLGKIAYLGNPMSVPRLIEPAIEIRWIRHDSRRQSKNALEGEIGESEVPASVELCDADRQMVEHGSLR